MIYLVIYERDEYSDKDWHIVYCGLDKKKSQDSLELMQAAIENPYHTDNGYHNVYMMSFTEEDNLNSVLKFLS